MQTSLKIITKIFEQQSSISLIKTVILGYKHVVDRIVTAKLKTNAPRPAKAAAAFMQIVKKLSKF